MGGDDPWVGKVVSIELGELYATQCKDLNISRFSYFFFFFFFFLLKQIIHRKSESEYC